jgi:hypothetical protein
VACPYFYPVERFDDHAWAKPPRLPLGDPCRGSCRAVPGEAFIPGDDQQRELCNLGYARKRCRRFPTGAEADAVRFSIESDDGERLEIVYVLEKDWAPVRHGRVECGRDGVAGSENLDGILKRQMEFFTASYLARRYNRAPLTCSAPAP